ncbi:MAG: aminoacyl-tRNA hydrolase [Planctomycetota bacterium]
MPRARLVSAAGAAIANPDLAYEPSHAVASWLGEITRKLRHWLSGSAADEWARDPRDWKILVGIGNPGAQYACTRHNLGFSVVDETARLMGVAFSESSMVHAAIAHGTLEGRPLLLVKPLTFVNRSGPVLQTLREKTGVALADLLVAVDDLALAPGRIRLRAGGSAGGHNGLSSIEASLGTDRYPRLRLGIGGAGAEPIPKYVLAPVPDAERPAVNAAVERAVEAVRSWLRLDLQQAMAAVNAPDPEHPPPDLDHPQIAE